MAQISVITPSIRPEGLKLVEKALDRQVFSNFEWLVDDSDEKNEGDYWGLYKAYNRLIRRAKAPLIVSWQDYTYALPTTLEKFYFHFTKEPKTFVTGVGNKYLDDTFTVKTWQDPRERDDQGTFYPCFYNDVELNLASFNRDVFYDIGGFDEDLDKHSSACGLDVLVRANIVGGWEFKIDQTIKSYSLEHGRLPMWEENNPFKNGVWGEKLKEYEKNPVLDYLGLV